MKTAPLFLLLAALALTGSGQGVSQPPARLFTGALVVDGAIGRVRAADDERVAATVAADPVRLDTIFSDELRYAHSNGRVDTKASYVQSLVSRNAVYESFDYKERNFKAVAPGIVLMSGRVIIHASNAGHAVVNDLNFLAVWREENGRWRFLAWQSCRNQPAAPPPGK